MKNQIRKAIIVGFLSVSLPVLAGGGGMTGGATEVTQLLNNAQLAQQYATQIQQYQSQLKNLASLQQWAAVNPAAALSRLANVVEGGEALGLSGARIAAKMEAAYGSNIRGATVSDYNTWMKTTKDSIRGAMRAIGAQQDDFASEADNIRMLADASKNASNSGGAVAVAQAGNQIAVEMLQQMQKLRTMNATQSQALNAHMLAAQNKEEGERKQLDNFYNKKQKTYEQM